MSKQPLYTVLGWTVWQVGKRYAKRRARSAARRFLIFGAVGAAATAAAVLVASTASGD